MNVPFRSQYDASPYQNSNCGPSALAMVLEAYGLDVSNERLRAIADQLQGTSGYNDGIALDYLVQIAQQAGLRSEGLNGPDGHYRQWAMGDIIREIRRGYPVITLVHFATLPAHTSSSSTSDHYVVVVGLTGDGFVINDPAAVGNEGYRQLLRPEQLLAAWHAASVPYQAVAFLPPDGKLGLALNDASAGPGFPGTTAIATGSVAASQRPAPAPGPVSTPTIASVQATLPGNPPRAARLPSPSAIPPPPNATFAAWSVNLGNWQHAAPVATLHAVPPTVAGSGQALVLSERTTNGNTTAPALIVVGLVAAAAMAILRAPREDDWPAGRER